MGRGRFFCLISGDFINQMPSFRSIWCDFVRVWLSCPVSARRRQQQAPCGGRMLPGAGCDALRAGGSGCEAPWTRWGGWCE